MATNLKPHHERLVGQSRKADSPLYIDQQWLQIEVFVRWFAGKPPLPPCTECTHQIRQLPPRFGEFVFGAVGTVSPGDCPGEYECLEPFGKDSAGHSRNAPADVIEAAAAAQDFPHDQKGPAAAQHFVGA